jgi:hypothetical protein
MDGAGQGYLNFVQQDQARRQNAMILQKMAEEQQARQRALDARGPAGAQLYQMFGGQGQQPPPQGVPPPPMAGPGGVAPPPAGTPQGGPMPPPPGANLGPPAQPQAGGMPNPPLGAPPAPAGGPPAAPPAAPMVPPQAPPQIPPFRPMPQAAPMGAGGPGQIAPPPAAPAPAGTGLSDPGKQFNLPALIQQLKSSGVPPDKVMDMLDQLGPVMNAQNQQELNMFKAQTTAAQAAERFYKDQLNFALLSQKLDVAKQTEERKGRQGDTRLDQGQQKINITRKQLEGGDFTPQDISFWTEVLQKGGSLPPRLATTPGGKKLLADIMKGTARGNVSPVEMLANQAEFMGEKQGQRTLGTRTANIEMAATEAAGLSALALKASEEWNRTGIKSLNDLEKYAQGKTASPTLRRFVAANTSFINAYARAINPQGVGTVADKEHAREMLEVGFAKGDYAAAIDQLQSEISVAQKSPGKVKESMRERFTGSGRQVAPQEALDFLKAHPETAQQFSAKYGYLPAGVR